MNYQIKHGDQTFTMHAPNYPDHITDHWKRGRFYESGANGMLSRCEQLKDIYEGAHALDIGGHMGNHATFFSRVLGMTVMSFEPNFESWDYLHMNGLDHGYLALHQPLGAKDHALYHIVDGPFGNTGMSRAQLFENGEMVGSTVDFILKGFYGSLGIIKIDVEGAEMDVLEGAKQTIKEQGPDLWIETKNPAGIVLWLYEHCGLKYISEGPYNATPTFRFHTNPLLT